MNSSPSEALMTIYNNLLEHFGPRHWWPAETRLEIVVGAVLTQAVAWKNVEKAIENLKQAGVLNINSLLSMEEEELARLIHPALYHRQKARKLKKLFTYMEDRFQGDLDVMLQQNWRQLRPGLLEVWGLGPETVDSILLYAGNHPVFVVDAYTRRIMYRQGLVEENIDYSGMQVFLEHYCKANAELYNEFHALLVALGSHYCKKNKPLCSKCPIGASCINLPGGQDK